MHLLIKYLVKLILFLASRHRIIGIRDFQAAIGATVILSLWTIGTVVIKIIDDWHGISSLNAWPVVYVIFSLALASVPITFIIKLRRFGITDADYSVASGINYKAALKSARAGFQFLGIGASKLTAEQAELKDAIKVAGRAGEPIKMLLVDPDADTVFQHLEKKDGATGYGATVKGSVLLLKTLATENKDFMSVRFYQPVTMEDVKPFRLFFADGACLLSPFSHSTGEKDQGRSLPQIRLTSVGFPNASDPTLYTALKRYFEKSWNDSEKEEKQ